jgi:heat shock protein HslJ
MDACKTRPVAQENETNPSKNLLEKYWKLDQIMGTDISTLDPKLPNNAYITFKDGNKIVGNAGCNAISGTYELGTGNKIHFSKVVTTLKMCMDMTVEEKMKQAFQLADSYYVKNDTLILNRARMAPLAQFVAVYMK